MAADTKVDHESIEYWRGEALRLRKLFDDAGQGEYNVLALVDHYQAQCLKCEERMRAMLARRWR